MITGNDNRHTVTVNDGAEYTFEIGAKCAKVLPGIVEAGYPVKQDVRADQYYCVRSGDQASTPAACVISCQSPHHPLRRMIKSGNQSVYYFLKD